MRSSLILLFASALFCFSCTSSDPSHEISPNANCINNENSDISTAVLCNSCLQNLSTEDDAVARLIHTLHQKRGPKLNEDNFGRKKLADLNYDVLLLIFERIDIMDMTNLLTVYPSKTLFAVASDTFWQRFKDYNVIIKQEEKTKKISIHNERSKSIEVHTRKMAATILKYFGGAIQQLTFNSAISDLNGYVNQYGCNSLAKLDLGFIDEDTLKFKKPFTRLEELSLSASFRMKTGKLTFDQMFPNIRRAKFDSLHSFLCVELPHLERLEITDSWNGLPHFEEMLSKNPQIKDLEIGTLSQVGGNTITKHLKNLKSLSVSEVRVGKRAIRFEHVNEFKVRSYTENTMQFLSFPELESVQIKTSDYKEYTLDSTRVDNWVQFAKRHRNLSYLGFEYWGNKKHVRLLLPLFNELSNIVEASIQGFFEHFYPENLAAIEQTCKKLVKLDVWVLYDPPVDNFRERFANNWNITVEPSRWRKMLIFKRIN